MTVLAERILDCFPSGSYALTALLRLMDVVESDEVPTAAVECRIQPRLLINPGFVDRHAETPEKLLMLVMHELHHVLLGHTRLFPCITQTQNFVFDCVINALISRMFPAREHTAFLTGFYSDKHFPECLLRPPTRWNGRNVLTLPKGILDLSKKGCRLVGETYRALYSDSGATYHEVYEVLPKLVPENALGSIPLLGGHNEESATAGDLDHRSPVLFDTVRGIVEKWPQPPDPIQGRSLADIIDERTIDVNPVPSNRTILRTLLRKVGDVMRGGRVRRVGSVQVPSQTPIPIFDRRSVVLQGLGVEPLLHRGFVSVRRRTFGGEKVHVYLDVSGSMERFSIARNSWTRPSTCSRPRSPISHWMKFDRESYAPPAAQTSLASPTTWQNTESGGLAWSPTGGWAAPQGITWKLWQGPNLPSRTSVTA